MCDISRCSTLKRLAEVSAACTVVLVLSGVAGCPGASEKTHPDFPVPRSASSQKLESESDANKESRVQEVERVKRQMDPLIAELQRDFGEGTNSPCSSSSSELFTSRCSDATQATERVVQAAIDAMGYSRGYVTLRAVADKVTKAINGYGASRCSLNPADPSQRTKCLDYGAVIAQAPTDLHQGVVAGLSGN